MFCALIMAGGKGTRLYPYTKILPKALIPIGEIPISERIMHNFSSYGCTRFFMVVNHKKNMIQAYFDSAASEYDITYVEEDRPLGTGGGLYLLENEMKQDFFLVNCDIIVDAVGNLDCGYILAQHLTAAAHVDGVDYFLKVRAVDVDVQVFAHYAFGQSRSAVGQVEVNVGGIGGDVGVCGGRGVDCVASAASGKRQDGGEGHGEKCL